MEIIIYIAIGIFNGIFSSGAGQLFLWYNIYLKKRDSKNIRNISLFIIPIISIPACIIYIRKAKIKILQSLILCVISIIFGTIGNIIMKKINSNILNLISGIILIIITGFNLWRMI